MSVRNVLLAIFIPPIIGALIPFLFSGMARSSIGEAMVCATVQSAAKKGYVDAAGKKRMIAEATASVAGDAIAKDVFDAAAKRGC